MQLEVLDAHYEMPLCVSLSHSSDQISANEHNIKRLCSHGVFKLIVKIIFRVSVFQA